MRHIRSAAIAGVLGLFLAPAPAQAQLQARPVVTGLTNPLEFVPDPSDPNVFYVLEQAGRVRIIRSGVLLASDFLDLRGQISSGGERGLLGLAFAPDYATSGRVFMNFTNPNGHTVVARFIRNSPTSVAPASRFDLQWPDGRRFIEQPFANHNGGHLAFGPDGFLYIGMGDGGSANDPGHRAQNPSTLLGKMLRIDVNVPDTDAKGYRLAGNPPTVSGALGEIWAFGVRNPWKFAFDNSALGGTGAMVIGDVGQGAWEEIDYQPAGVGGQNYGWRNREGSHNNVTSLPPAYTPLVDPIFEYSHAVGISITGGYVYRGTRLPRSFRGRYFFGDLSGRVWSLGLTLDGTGHAAASGLIEHTGELGGIAALGNISAFGEDRAGELYIVGYSTGTLWQITASQPAMTIDAPAAGARVVQPFAVAGWAIDRAAPTGTGVDAVHVYAYPNPGSNTPPVFLGVAGYGNSRPDVGAAFGGQFALSGFNLTANGLASGPYRLTVFARSTATRTFSIAQTADITIVDRWAIVIDSPAAGQSAPQPLQLSGWAVDLASTSGTGVDTLHVYAYPNPGSGQPPVFVGVASYGIARPDVAAAFGPQFRNSGYRVTIRGLPPGLYRMVVFLHSSITGAFQTSQTVDVTVGANPLMSIDGPANGTAVTRPFLIAGWALDAAAGQGTGVDAIHLWAFPDGGGSAVLLGAAQYGIDRLDVARVFGAQFQRSGYGLTTSGLAPGSYVVVVFAHSTVTGTFNQSRAIRLTIR